MADVLKVVAARIQKTSLSATLQPTLQPQGPRFGNVIAEASSQNDPQETRTVLWDNALVQDVQAGTVAALNLDVIEDPENDTVTEFLGNVVLRIDATGVSDGSTDPAGGTSREFTGLVVGIYKRTPIDATPGSGDDYLLIQTIANGLYFEDLASAFTVLGNR
jgi:hypothetical protein